MPRSEGCKHSKHWRRHIPRSLRTLVWEDTWHLIRGKILLFHSIEIRMYACTSIWTFLNRYDYTHTNRPQIYLYSRLNNSVWCKTCDLDTPIHRTTEQQPVGGSCVELKVPYGFGMYRHVLTSLEIQAIQLKRKKWNICQTIWNNQANLVAN